jgi:transcription initiation factor TFIID subunit 8
MSLLRRAALMANTQRRTIPSPVDLSYAFLMENVHTYHLEDEMSHWPSPPQLHFDIEMTHPALLPSPVNELVYTRAILPPALRPQTTTPSFIPSSFPRFPAKHTYSFTPSYPPRAVDPETIRRKVVEERALIESSLAKLVSGQVTRPVTSTGNKEGRERREEVWWETWRELGCDLDTKNEGVWPVERDRRGITWSL